MKKKPERSHDAADLRRHAEERLRIMQEHEVESDSQADIHSLLHELQVHQIELEMQNYELRSARNEMELLLEKYTDLYDFAPVGYFSLDAQGHILEANLPGSSMLGVDRGELIGQSLTSFTTPECKPVFQSFLERVFTRPDGQSCEVILVKTDQTACWVACHGTSSFYTHVPHDLCRVAVSDITAQRLAEEAQRELNTMSIANQALEQEIVQRKVVEKDLRTSEQQTADLLGQSHQLQEQLRSLSRRILTVQEEERKRISRELHDEIIQTLISINVQLESLAKEAGLNPKGLRKSIAQTQKQVEKSVEIAHRFARELRPPVLDDLGLIPALETAMKKFMNDTGIHVALKAFAGIDKLEIEKRMTLYRVAQEALANVALHARASRVDVTIQQLASAVLMQVKDNGRSFNVDKVLHSKKKMPLGLLGMRERVEMVDGTLTIDSTPANGTTVHALIPMASKAGKNPRR